MPLMNASDITTESVRLALGAASLRQAVISNNIANVNSPDHVRMRVIFEQHLADALDAANHGVETTASSRRMENLRPELVPVDGPQNSEIDEEVAQLSINALRYHALSKGLTRYISIATAIATGGRA